MRVLRIIPTIDPEVGGPSNSAVNQAIAEANAGVSTTFVFTGDEASARSTSRSRRRLEDSGVRTLMFPRPRWLSTQAGLWGVSLPLVAWLVRNVRRYDVVHVHYVWTLTTLVGAALGSVTGRPVVLTAHESLTRYDIDTASGSGTKRRLKLALRRVLMRRVDVVVCASPLEQRDSLQVGERGVVIYHPVVEHPREDPQPEPGQPPFVIGYLGRLHPKKNVDKALEAVAALPDARFVVCGDGDARYRQQLVSLADELHVSDRTEWRGHVDAEGRQALFAECHVTVMPSSYECFGMAGAEALAAGVPVVLTSSTGIASIVADDSSGCVVQQPDAALLAAALRSLQDSSRAERASMRRRAITGATKSLSFDAYGAAVRTLYLELTPGASASHDPVQETSIERLTAAS